MAVIGKKVTLPSPGCGTRQMRPPPPPPTPRAPSASSAAPAVKSYLRRKAKGTGSNKKVGGKRKRGDGGETDGKIRREESEEGWRWKEREGAGKAACCPLTPRGLLPLVLVAAPAKGRLLPLPLSQRGQSFLGRDHEAHIGVVAAVDLRARGGGAKAMDG